MSKLLYSNNHMTCQPIGIHMFGYVRIKIRHATLDIWSSTVACLSKTDKGLTKRQVLILQAIFRILIGTLFEITLFFTSAEFMVRSERSQRTSKIIHTSMSKFALRMGSFRYVELQSSKSWSSLRRAIRLLLS